MLKGIAYLVLIPLTIFVFVSFYLFFIGALILVILYILLVHALGTPIKVTKAGVKIGEVRRFKYYPTRY